MYVILSNTDTYTLYTLNSIPNISPPNIVNLMSSVESPPCLVLFYNLNNSRFNNYLLHPIILSVGILSAQHNYTLTSHKEEEDCGKKIRFLVD